MFEFHKIKKDKIVKEIGVTKENPNSLYISYNEIVEVYKNGYFFGDMKMLNGALVSESRSITEFSKRHFFANGLEWINRAYLN